MNIKNVIPGFTAEASLQEATALYRPEVEFANGAKGPAIFPQRIKLKEVRCNCDTQTDICACDDGSVFHQVLGLLDLF